MLKSPDELSGSELITEAEAHVNTIRDNTAFVFVQFYTDLLNFKYLKLNLLKYLTISNKEINSQGRIQDFPLEAG